MEEREGQAVGFMKGGREGDGHGRSAPDALTCFPGTSLREFWLSRLKLWPEVRTAGICGPETEKDARARFKEAGDIVSFHKELSIS